jgi:hypothetical protein
VTYWIIVLDQLVEISIIRRMVLNMEATKRTFLKSTLAVALLASGAAFATPTSGQLVIVNSLGDVDVTSGTVGASASAVSVVVSDTTGPCSTTASVAYNGTVVVKWNSNATHSTTSCTSITSVAVTPLKTNVGTMSTVVYNSATGAAPITTATAATFTPPTTVYENLGLVINGSGVPASIVSAAATVWGVPTAAVKPVFVAANGALSTVGIPGAVGAYGLKAENLMRRYAVIPHHAAQ